MWRNIDVSILMKYDVKIGILCYNTKLSYRYINMKMYNIIIVWYHVMSKDVMENIKMDNLIFIKIICGIAL